MLAGCLSQMVEDHEGTSIAFPFFDEFIKKDQEMRNMIETLGANQ